MVLHHQKVSTDDGFMVINTTARGTKEQPAAAVSERAAIVQWQQPSTPTGGAIYAFIGPHGQHPFTMSPITYTYAGPTQMRHYMETRNWSVSEREELEASSERAEKELHSNLLFTMQSVLQNDFPGPQQCVGITEPHCRSEKQTVELMLLETLAECIHSGANGEAHELVRQIEEEAGVPFTEVVQDARRAEMRRYIQEQNDQHAAMVAAHALARPEVSREASASPARTKLQLAKAMNAAAALSSSASQQAAVESSVASTPLPERVQAWQQARRVKYRHVDALFRRVLKALSKSSVTATITVSGSHHTLHTRDSQPLTLVRVHSKKDASMGGRYATRLAERLMQVTERIGLQC